MPANAVTKSISGLSRETSALAARHELADVGVGRAQHRALVQRLAHRHEDARRQSLAGDVADQEEQPALVEHEEVVEVAADLARRRHRGREVDARSPCSSVGARQAWPVWMRCAASSSPAMRAACSRCACTTRSSAAALARRLGQRQHQQHAEEQQQAQAPASRRRTAGAASGKRRTPAAPAARRRPAAAAPRCAAPSAASAQISSSPSPARTAPSSARRPRRAAQQRAVEQVLQQLRVDLAARHALADRRVLVVEQRRRRSGRSAPAGLRSSAGVDPAFEHVDRRDEAVGVACARSRRAPRRRPRSARRTAPTATPLHGAALDAQRAAPARRSATRSISIASVGTSVPSTLATSGMRRITPRDGSTEIRPQPRRLRSSSSMLVSAPARRHVSVGAGARRCRRTVPARRAAASASASCVPAAKPAPTGAGRARAPACASLRGRARSARARDRSSTAPARAAAPATGGRPRASGCRRRSPPASARG